MKRKNLSKTTEPKNYQHKDFIFFWNFKLKNSNSIKFKSEFLVWDFITSSKYKNHDSKKKIKQHKKFFFEYGYKNIIDDIGNPLHNSEYFSTIFSTIKKSERKFTPNYDYIKYQPDININMRAILVDWLIDIHDRFKLLPKTLFLAVNIIDRFLTLKSISRQKLQLLGIAAMLIASKYEEVYALETKDFVYISDNAYTKEDIFKMENLICNNLKYNFSSPSLLNMLSFSLKKNEDKKENIFFSCYFLEITLLEYYFLKYFPSTITSSIVIFVEELLFYYYNKKFLKKEKFSNIYIENCQNVLKSNVILNQNQKHKLTANKRKFLAKKYGEVSSAIFGITFLN